MLETTWEKYVLFKLMSSFMLPVFALHVQINSIDIQDLDLAEEVFLINVLLDRVMFICRFH